MTGRPSSRSLVLVGLVVAAASLPGCRDDRSPRRVPDDGAPCSAVMPGAPKSGDRTFRLASVVVTERVWSLVPPAATADPPKDRTAYFVRRETVPPGSALKDAALLDAAAARITRGIELQDGTTPVVAKSPTAEGEAVDLRWIGGKARNATRLLLMPGGYCEVTILGAQTDADVASFLGSGKVRP